VFSVSFLSYAALLVGEYLIVEQQRLAFLAFTSIVGFRLRGRFRKLFGKSSNATDDPDDSGSAAPAQSPDSLTAEESESRKLGNATDEPAVTNDPKILSSPALHPPSPLLAAEERNGVGASPPDSAASPESETRAASPGAAPQSKPPKPDKKKRSVRKRLTKLAVRLLKLTAVSGAAAAVLFYGHMELRIAGAFNVLPVHNADVRAEVEGIVEDICVDEGDLVRQGDLIARLSDRDLKAELQKTEAQIDENRARLRLLEAGARPEEIQLAQYAVTRAEEQLKFARDRLGRDRQLYEQQLLSLNDYQESARQVASGSSDLADAKKKLDILLAGTRPEEIEAMKAQVTSLETQRRHLEDQLRLMRVVSPTTGIVTTPSRQLKEMKYQLVKKGDLIAKVHDIRTVTVEIVISEKEIGDVKVGQKVALKARAYPDVTFNGQVTSIATTARTGSSSGSPVSSSASATGGGATPKMVLVTTEIDNDSRLLKPEMTGRAKIYCGQRRLFDLVTRRLSRTLRVEFWSWW
jgi:HlyD family secretion protein